MGPSIRTLHSCLRELARGEPDKILIGCDSIWLSAAQVLARTEAVATKLIQLGLRSGDLVALRSHRSVDTILMILGLQAMGAVAVLTDPRHRADSFLEANAPSIPVTAIIDRGLLTDKRTHKQTFITPGTLPEGSFSEKTIDPHAPGFIIFTSGPAGTCKAVMLSQYNLINSLLDSRPLGDYREDDIALGALPLDHVFGLVLLAGTVVLHYALYLPDRTDIASILQAVQQQRLTRMSGVPSLYLAMAEKSEKYDLSSLRAGFIGGGPCTQEQFVFIEERLDMTLIPVYGISEFIGISCGSFRDPQEIRARGVGRFFPTNRGKILLPDSTEARSGQVGEICVDGPARMIGYFGDGTPRPELLHTGDLGYVDEDGILHIRGRKKDMITRNGISLSPLRIEQALLAIPGVEEAAVVGLSHATQGQVPWAMAVSRRTELELLAYLPRLLARNEIPLGIYLVDAIPKNASGKPDKNKIQEMLLQWAKA